MRLAAMTVWALLVFMAPAVCWAQGPPSDSVVVTKNLFSPERSPGEPSTAGGGSAVSNDLADGAVQLLGVSEANGRRQALVAVSSSFLGSASGESLRLWVEQGDMLGNFVVERIERTRVQLGARGRSYLVDLE